MSLEVIHPDNVRLPSRRKFNSETDTKNNKSRSINLKRTINEIKLHLLIFTKVPLLTSRPVKNDCRWPWCMEPTVVFTICDNRTATRSAVARFLGLRPWIAPGTWKSVSCECCMLSGRGLCDRPILRPSPNECGASECDLETSTMSWRPRPQ